VKLVIKVRPCENLPRGYGFAYRTFHSDYTYCAPIPLNFLIGAWHNFYWWVLVRGWFNQSPLIGVQNVWRGKGFSEGEEYGYKKGISHSKTLVDEGLVQADKAYFKGKERGYEEGWSDALSLKAGAARRWIRYSRTREARRSDQVSGPVEGRPTTNTD
jgi:hypothetical protein